MGSSGGQGRDLTNVEEDLIKKQFDIANRGFNTATQYSQLSAPSASALRQYATTQRNRIEDAGLAAAVEGSRRVGYEQNTLFGALRDAQGLGASLNGAGGALDPLQGVYQRALANGLDPAFNARNQNLAGLALKSPNANTLSSIGEQLIAQGGRLPQQTTGGGIMQSAGLQALRGANGQPIRQQLGRLEDISRTALGLSQQYPLGNQVQTLSNISNQALSRAGQAPLANQITSLSNISNEALNRSRGTPLASQISGLAGLGAAPGAAEAALTPQAITNLSQAQAGQVPEAIQRLYSGADPAARSALENQFSAARQRLIDSGVRGGALTRALAGLEGQRALGIGEQVNQRAQAAANATIGLMNQATTYGLTQPFQRQQLQLQGLGASGELAGQQASLGNQLVGLGLEARNASGQLASTERSLGNQMFGLGLDARNASAQLAAQAQDQRANLLGLSANAAQAGLQGGLGQGDLQQGYLGLAQQAGAGLSNEAQQLAALRGQLYESGGNLANAALQGQLASLGFQGDVTQQSIQNMLAGGALRTEQLGLAGNLAGQYGGLSLNLAGAQNDALAQRLGLQAALAGQLGAGGTELQYATSPALLTQGVQLQNLIAQSYGIPVDILRGGGNGTDLGSALAAASNAANYQGGPSRSASMISGALQGGASGASAGSVGGPYGALIGGVLGAGLGAWGGS